MVKHTPVKNHVPNYEQLKENFETVHKLMQEKKIVAASTIKFGGLGATIAKMAFGSKVGVAINTEEDVYGFNLGSMIVEATDRWTDCPVLAGLDLGDYASDAVQSESGSSQELMSRYYIGIRGAWNKDSADLLEGGEELWNKLTAGAVSTASAEG